MLVKAIKFLGNSYHFFLNIRHNPQEKLTDEYISRNVKIQQTSELGAFVCCNLVSESNLVYLV